MLTDIPLYVPLLFVLITILALVMFGNTLKKSAGSYRVKIVLPFLVLWLAAQGILALNGVYSAPDHQLPPKLLIIGILPPILLILLLLMSRPGRKFMDSLPLKEVTWFNIIRLPVEIGLLLLYVNHAVPRLMTFEGGNLDILSGLSAPLIAYYGFTRANLGKKTLLIWNFVCLALLLNIVGRALLSAPFPTQKLAFNEPNIAVLHFPFVWLPTFIVPLVLLGHVTSIRRLLLSKAD